MFFYSARQKTERLWKWKQELNSKRKKVGPKILKFVLNQLLIRT